MKRLLLVLSFCFVIVGVKAQNIWKPISYSGTFLGAGPDGSIYCYDNDITCSKDEGATWQITELGESDCAIQDLVVKENGDVYFCLSNYNRMLDQGVYHSTINDMHNWEVVAFDGILRSPQVAHQAGKDEWQ